MMSSIACSRFASSRLAGDSSAASLAALYAEVATTHGFTMAAERIRVAANGAFAEWSRPVAEGDEIAFLPPVSGG